ncbi:ATP-binding cassette domain-containing protein [Exiguobacterium sp. JMULE1]|uniref:ATP-binding cassette domain-containing protein n=1 Tax=Exiguobacterium sp. JMULE1 TaxID=2518339 RepID=UPI0015769289|nr:ATP-binding cassette domain-containing protein [Exiguobacterium sp. JMULE1]NTY10667.1 ATP-binding cassette domain-containing protein [Exiguobacterium sp. JMULE1]
MIEIRQLTKSFQGKVLFENLSLTISQGDFVIFSGPSGCGKTTLLNMIGALEPIDTGTIVVDGKDITNKRNQLAYFRTKLGFLFQNFALVDQKTVRQNLEIVQKRYRSGKTIEEVLTSVGLSDKIDQKVFMLSGGEQQRVALARLMLKQCDIILADEPTGSLDQANVERVMALLQELNDRGKTIILVTHDEAIKRQGKRLVEIG